MKPSLEELVSNGHTDGRGEGQAAQRAGWFGLCFALGPWLLGCVIWQSRDPKGMTSVVFCCPACIFYTGISISLAFAIPCFTPHRAFFLPAANNFFCNPQRSLTLAENPFFHTLSTSVLHVICVVFSELLLLCAELPLFTTVQLSHSPSHQVTVTVMRMLLK